MMYVRTGLGRLGHDVTDVVLGIRTEDVREALRTLHTLRA